MNKLIINQQIKEFVKELNGRYEHYLDEATICTLLERLMTVAIKYKHTNTISEAAYNAGCIVFETLLEYGLDAGGNGHHVAQSLANKFTQ